MDDPLRLVLAVVVGWVLVGLVVSALAAPLARTRGPRAAWLVWAVVVLPVFGTGAWFVIREPVPLPLGPFYHMLLLAMLTVLPTAAAVWTASLRARREEQGWLFVDVLLSTFTFIAVLLIGFVAGIIPDLMTTIGA